MKLTKVDFDLDWPKSIEIINLRKYIMVNLMKKGSVVRWSITDIQDSGDSLNKRKLRINAVLAISTKSEI